MTAQQLYLFSGLYLVALVVVAFFTRATVRRIAGALAGAAVASAVALGVDALGEAVGLWRMAIWGPVLLPLSYIGFVVSIAPIYLVTWRVARRFGWRGLAVCLCVVAIIGPPRDYLIATKFPAWMVFAPGVAPILADAATYVGIVAIGHAVMRLVTGPSREGSAA